MLIHLDAFDNYATSSDYSQRYINYNNVGLSTNGGRFGNGCLQLTGSSSYLSWTYTISGLTNIWTGFALKIYNEPVNGTIMQFISPYGTEMKIQYNPFRGVWYVLNTNNTVVLATPHNMTTNTWHWIDIYFSFGSSGNVAVFLNNVQVFDYSGNTAPLFISTFSTIMLGDNNNGTINPAIIDDWYVSTAEGGINTSGYGDAMIQTILPNRDAGPNDGTPSTAGPHYLMVNEPQWSSNNSILINNSQGQAEVFGMQSISGSISYIYGVQVLTIVNKENSGTMFGNTTLSSNNVNVYSNSTSLSTSYAVIAGLYEVDPNTSNAWTESGVNNISCGFRVF